MIELIAAIITNRWLADTSVLHHINPVPAAGLDWKSATWLVGLAIATAAVGASASNCATWQVHESRAGASRAQITRSGVARTVPRPTETCRQIGSGSPRLLRSLIPGTSIRFVRVRSYDRPGRSIVTVLLDTSM